MKSDFDFIVQKRATTYVFVAKQFGVVVRADDPSVGIKELENRVEDVAAQFREAGVDLPQKIEVPVDARESVASRPSSTKFLILVLLVVGAISWPISFLYARSASLIATLEHPISLFIQFANKVDEVTPGRMDELKLVVRRLAAKVAPLVEEARKAIVKEQQASPVGKDQPDSH